jgi:hypothetical protein
MFPPLGFTLHLFLHETYPFLDFFSKTHNQGLLKNQTTTQNWFEL